MAPRSKKGKYHRWITDEGLALLQGWARDGLIDEQIAKNIGIRRQTLYQWQRRFPSISDALKKGKEVVDYEVENALLKRALGYQCVEIRKRTIDGRSEEVTETVRHVPADVTAQIFWLKNRKRQTWRDRMPEEEQGKASDWVQAVIRAAKQDEPS